LPPGGSHLPLSEVDAADAVPGALRLSPFGTVGTAVA